MTRWLLICMLLLAPVCRAQSTLTTLGQADTMDPGEQDPSSRESSPDQSSRSNPTRNMPSISIDSRREANDAYIDRQQNVPPRISRPPLAKTEFELFAEDVTGHPLLTYGRKLFDDVPSTFAPVDRVPVPADYVLGPGDELLIRAWGKISIDARVTIDRDGQIYLPKVGTLNVAGLRYNQVDGYLHSAISALFKDFELNVALGQLRSIQIFVLGSARRPGAYTVGSLSTMVNALFVSGGPSATGSMRHVQLIRNNQVVTEFDIYDLVKRGDKSHDRPLLPGDILFIPPVGPQAAIVGSVEEPGIYELSLATTVASALQSAGGLTSLAETKRVLLERVEDHSRRRVEEFALDAAGKQRVLKDGDLLQILPVSPEFENTVTLRGNVAQPGRYAWHEGMRVSDLIPSRDFLLTREYWNRENHVVAASGKHQFGDPRLPSYSAQDKAERVSSAAAGNRGSQDNSDSSLEAEGARDNRNQLQPGNRDTDDTAGRSPGDGNTEEDAPRRFDNSGSEDDPSKQSGAQKATDIVRINSEINWHYASIERLDEHDLSPRLIAFQLGNAIDDKDSTDDQILRAGDVVTIFSRADIPLPIEEHAAFVRVGGEVNAPGVYRVNPGATLRDAVKQAGGLTPHSYLYASQLLRVSTRHIQEEQLKRSTEQMERELSASFANNSLPTANKDADQAQLSMRQALIARISSIAPTGRVVLEMKPDASTLADIPDFTVEDGDTFYIPPQFSTVQVSGAVYNENAFRYQQNKLTTAYLADAGGATRDADVKRMFLIRADGTVISRQSRGTRNRASFEKTALLPGDAIVIPVKLNAGAGWRQLEEITGILSQGAITAASLAVISK
jgi:protein involved in polysaccharide export with SLBB domain